MSKVNLLHKLHESLQHNPYNLTVALEALVDAHSVRAVLLDLAAICHEKAEHVRVNWQDGPIVKKWDRAGQVCDQAQAKVTV